MPNSVLLPRVMRIGAGASAELGELVVELGLCRPLVVTDTYLVEIGTAGEVASSLQKAGAKPQIFCDTVPDPTTDSLRLALRAVQEHRADSVVGLGGGSPMDTAKAVAFLAEHGGQMRDYKAPRVNTGRGLPMIAVPTTAGSGSEATQFTIITDTTTDEKMLCQGPSFMPVAAVVDADLTMSMPPRLTADTGIDALTHAIEAYVSCRANPFSDSLALAAMATIGRHLRPAYADGGSTEARAAMIMAATQAGMAFSNSSVALVHGMSRPIGAHFHVSHGLSNAMLFPAVTAFSLPGAVSRYADCARILGAATTEDGDDTAAAGLVQMLRALCGDLAVPTPRSLGIEQARWDQLTPLMAEQALASGSPANNPVVPSAEQIRELYAQIYC